MFNHKKKPVKWLRRVWRFPRLVAAVMVGITVAIVAQYFRVTFAESIVLAWDTCAAFYLFLAAQFVITANHQTIMARTHEEDAGGLIIVIIALLASALSLLSIFALLGHDADGGSHHVLKVLLPVLTILNSWAFIHTAFSFHYAHAYYANAGHGIAAGLQFPGDEQPGYTDFLYFSFIVGTSGQTADVEVASGDFRRMVLFHSVLSYLFNAAVLSLLINVAAGLIR